MVLVGLALAAASAAASQLGFLLRHRGAVAAPDVEARHPIRSAVGLFKSKWWSIGYAVAFFAYLLHVGALGMAPLSLVQSVLAGGLVLLGVMAEKIFDCKLGRREWTGMALACLGLAVLAITGRGGEGAPEYSVGTIVIFESVLVGVGAAMILSGQTDRSREQRGVMLGVAAGLLFAVTHIAMKAMAGRADEGILALLTSPGVPVLVIGAIVAFFASARSLQLGQAVPVIAMTSIAGNAATIPAGIVVFGDPLGSDALEVAGRSLAFVMVIGAAALIPAPVRAAERAKAAGQERDVPERDVPEHRGVPQPARG